jgi:hypothetical protein
VFPFRVGNDLFMAVAKRGISEPVAVLLGVAIGVVVFFMSCLLLAIYLNRRYQGTYSQGGCGKDALSSEKLKKLNIVSPIRRLDQWWPGVKDTLGLQGAVDNNHFVCVVCLEHVQPSHQIHELKCLHVFHKECLEKWFLGSHYSCPLCHRAYFHEPRHPVPDFVWMV